MAGESGRGERGKMANEGEGNCLEER